MLAASMLRSWKWVRRGLLGLVVVPIAQFLGIRYMVRRSVLRALHGCAWLAPGLRLVCAWFASGLRLVCVWCLR